MVRTYSAEHKRLGSRVLIYFIHRLVNKRQDILETNPIIPRKLYGHENEVAKYDVINTYSFVSTPARPFLVRFREALGNRRFFRVLGAASRTKLIFKGWFSLAHKHKISIASENTRDISVSISRNIRRTNPLICLMLFSLAHRHKHKRISVNISIRKTNIFVFLVLMLMQHKTNKWVRSSAYAYAYVAGVLTCLCLCNAYACAYAYALVRTGLKSRFCFMMV